MKKRILAALLALVMLFGALPMSVFAEDLETVEEPSGTFEPEQYEEPSGTFAPEQPQPQPDIPNPTDSAKAQYVFCSAKTALTIK